MSVSPPSPDSVDVFARWVAVVGAVTGIGGLAINYFGLDRRGRWRRRHANIQTVKKSLTALDQHVDPNLSALASPGLWTVTVETALSDIDTTVDAIPYRKFRSHLRQLHQQLVAVRGMNQPDADQVRQGNGFTLSQQQREGLRKARQELDALRKLEQKAAQKGVV